MTGVQQHKRVSEDGVTAQGLLLMEKRFLLNFVVMDLNALQDQFINICTAVKVIHHVKIKISLL
jgi:hypothetical protein